MTMTDDQQSPAAATPSAASSPPAPSRRRHAWIGILATVLGGILLLVLLVGGVFFDFLRGSVQAFDDRSELTASENLTVDLDYGQIDIRFTDDVEQAVFEVAGRWRGDGSPVELVAGDDGEMVLQTTQWMRFGPFNQEVSGSLLLPAELDGQLNLNAEVGAGALRIHGALDTIEAHVSTGELVLNDRVENANITVDVGSAIVSGGGGAVEARAEAGELVLNGDFTALTAHVSVGSMQVVGSVQEQANFSVDTGDGNIELRDTLPTRTEASVAIGDLDLDLPQVEMQLDAPASVRDEAESNGHSINAGAGAPQVVVHVEIGDVSIR